MSSTPYLVQPQRVGHVTDWNGTLLSQQCLQLLQPGCIVRIWIHVRAPGGDCAPYYQVTKVKDGTIWGVCLDCYNHGCYDEYHRKGCRVGDKLSFKFSAVKEIPVDWQPRRVKKELLHFLNPKHTGYGTGCC